VSEYVFQCVHSESAIDSRRIMTNDTRVHVASKSTIL